MFVCLAEVSSYVFLCLFMSTHVHIYINIHTNIQTHIQKHIYLWLVWRWPRTGWEGMRVFRMRCRTCWSHSIHSSTTVSSSNSRLPCPTPVGRSRQSHVQLEIISNVKNGENYGKIDSKIITSLGPVSNFSSQKDVRVGAAMGGFLINFNFLT